MTKAYRQAQILKLLRSRRLHTQEDLAQALRSIGVPATQVTLSRDIREMGLLKTPQGYVSPPEIQVMSEVEPVIRELLQDVRTAQNLVVLRTRAGNANALAVALDNANWPEITGTVAGDDTVLGSDGNAKTEIEAIHTQTLVELL